MSKARVDSSRTVSVRVSQAAIAFAKEAAQRTGRSVSAQIDHWARLAAAIERSPAMNRARVDAALKAEFDAEQLNELESEVFYSELFEAMETHETPASKKFYAELATKAGVDLDEAGRLVRRHPDGRTEML